MESEKLTEAVTETIFGMYTPQVNLFPTPAPEPVADEQAELEEDMEFLDERKDYTGRDKPGPPAKGEKTGGPGKEQGGSKKSNRKNGKPKTSDKGRPGRPEGLHNQGGPDYHATNDSFKLDAFDKEIASIYEQHEDLLSEMPEEMMDYDDDYEGGEGHGDMSDSQMLNEIYTMLKEHLAHDDVEMDYDDEDMMEAVQLQESMRIRLMEACKYKGYNGDACPKELNTNFDFGNLKNAVTNYIPYHKGSGKRVYYKGGKCYVNMNGCPREVNAKDCIYCDMGDAKTGYGPSGSLFS